MAVQQIVLWLVPLCIMYHLLTPAACAVCLGVACFVAARRLMANTNAAGASGAAESAEATRQMCSVSTLPDHERAGSPTSLWMAMLRLLADKALFCASNSAFNTGSEPLQQLAACSSPVRFDKHSVSLKRNSDTNSDHLCPVLPLYQSSSYPNSPLLSAELHTEISSLVSSILQVYINPWFSPLSVSTEFPRHVEGILEDAFLELAHKLSALRSERVLQLVIQTFSCHLEQLLPSFHHPLEPKSAAHPATIDRYTEWLYLESVATVLLKLVEPGDLLSAKAIHLMMVQVLCRDVFLPLLDLISKPGTIYHLIVVACRRGFESPSSPVLPEKMDVSSAEEVVRDSGPTRTQREPDECAAAAANTYLSSTVISSGNMEVDDVIIKKPLNETVCDRSCDTRDASLKSFLVSVNSSQLESSAIKKLNLCGTDSADTESKQTLRPSTLLETPEVPFLLRTPRKSLPTEETSFPNYFRRQCRASFDSTSLVPSSSPVELATEAHIFEPIENPQYGGDRPLPAPTHRVYITKTEARSEPGRGVYTVYCIEYRPATLVELSWLSSNKVMPDHSPTAAAVNRCSSPVSVLRGRPADETSLPTYRVKRRFNEFINLQTSLVRLGGRVELALRSVKGPSRWLANPFVNDKRNVINRRIYLQNYLRQLSALSEVIRTRHFQLFMGVLKNGDGEEFAYFTGEPGTLGGASGSNSSSPKNSLRIDRILVESVRGAIDLFKTALPTDISPSIGSGSFVWDIVSHAGNTGEAELNSNMAPAHKEIPPGSACRFSTTDNTLSANDETSGISPSYACSAGVACLIGSSSVEIRFDDDASGRRLRQAVFNYIDSFDLASSPEFSPIHRAVLKESPTLLSTATASIVDAPADMISSVGFACNQQCYEDNAHVMLANENNTRFDPDSNRCVTVGESASVVFPSPEAGCQMTARLEQKPYEGIARSHSLTSIANDVGDVRKRQCSSSASSIISSQLSSPLLSSLALSGVRHESYQNSDSGIAAKCQGKPMDREARLSTCFAPVDRMATTCRSDTQPRDESRFSSGTPTVNPLITMGSGMSFDSDSSGNTSLTASILDVVVLLLHGNDAKPSHLIQIMNRLEAIFGPVLGEWVVRKFEDSLSAHNCSHALHNLHKFVSGLATGTGVVSNLSQLSSQDEARAALRQLMPPWLLSAWFPWGPSIGERLIDGFLGALSHEETNRALVYKLTDALLSSLVCADSLNL